MRVWYYPCSVRLRETPSHSQFPGSLRIPVFPPSLLQWALSLRSRSWVVDASTGMWLHNSALWWLVIFDDDFPLLQTGVSLMSTLICGYQDKYLECSHGLRWFSKVVMGSPPRPLNEWNRQLWFLVTGLFPVEWAWLSSWRVVGVCAMLVVVVVHIVIPGGLSIASLLWNLHSTFWS